MALVHLRRPTGRTLEVSKSRDGNANNARGHTEEAGEQQQSAKRPDAGAYLTDGEEKA